ncbi:hypothetical protein DFP73DRAFT_567314 [Morchella snyderi]|nr:hypothetical protein DFP73DRAFT_567314 [Morchella snyderi]
MLRNTLLTVLLFISGFVYCATAEIPPACVLACVNEESAPSDIQAVCVSESAQTCLASRCGGSRQKAVDYFQTTCKSYEHEVAEPIPANVTITPSTRPTVSATAAPDAGNNGTKMMAFGGSFVLILCSIGYLIL